MQAAEHNMVKVEANKEATPSESRPGSPSSPGYIIRDGRTLAKIEVVLPRLKDVRRRKVGRLLTAGSDAPGPSQLDHDAMDVDPSSDYQVKPETVEGELPMLLEHSVPGSAEALHQAVEQMRNVGLSLLP